MTADITAPMLAGTSAAVTKTSGASGARAESWQQAMTRAFGATVTVQSRGKFPVGSHGASPLAQRTGLPVGLPSPQSASSFAGASPHPARPASVTPGVVERAPTVRGADVTAMALGTSPFTPTGTPPPRLSWPQRPLYGNHPGRSEPPILHNPNREAELAQACMAYLDVALEGGAASPMVSARLCSDGVVVQLTVPPALAPQAPRLIAATLNFFAQHGVRVASLDCNHDRVFDGTRAADRIDFVSTKD